MKKNNHLKTLKAEQEICKDSLMGLDIGEYGINLIHLM